MRNFNLLLLLFVFTASLQNTNAQSSSATNTVPTPNSPSLSGTDYSGWRAGTQTGGVLTTSGMFNAATSPEFVIKNEDPMSMSLYTNAGAGGFSNLRLWIKDDGGATTNTNGVANDGFVGIGDYSIATGSGTTPQNLMHLLLPSNAINVYQQFTSNNTGHAASNGFQVGLQYDGSPNFYTGGPQGTGTNYSIAALRQWMDAPMIFYTNDNNGNMSERMRIAYGNGGPNANA